MRALDFRGRWLLVTGASSGLGREMARQLAQRYGAHLILVARRKDRLEELARELESGTGVEVRTIVADLAEPADVERVIQEATRDVELYGAILNAGVTHFGPYEALAFHDFERMLAVNVRAAVRLVTALIPTLERSSGGLLLVASMAGITPVPYQSAYSATKAFLVHFGRCLWHELRGRSVSITTYAPGGIATEMTEGDHFGPLRGWLMPADQAASAALESFRRRRYVYVPGLRDQLGSLIMRLLPQRWATSLIARSYRQALLKSGKLSDPRLSAGGR